MSLTEKQKKYLKKNLGRRTIGQIIKALGISELDLRAHLAKKLTKEKYDRIFPDKLSQRPKKTSAFGLKSWFLKNRWRIALLALLVIVTYANSLNNDFLSDDINGIVKNKNLGDFKNVLVQPYAFVYASIRYLVVNIFGKVPAAFRSTSILAHLGATIGLYLLVSLLHLPQIGFLAAAIFAVHPLLCESIVWVSAGYNPYSAFLLLITFSVFVVSLQKKKKWLYWLSVLLYFLTLETSEKTIAFSVVLLLYLISWKKLKENWPKVVPFLLLSFIWGLYLMGALTSRSASLQKDFYQKLPQVETPAQFTAGTFRQSAIAISSYLGIIAWPSGLTLYRSEMNFTRAEYFIMVTILLSYLATTLYFFWRDKKTFFWLSFFPIILSPTLAPFGVSWIVAERYAYLASIGIFVIIALIFNRLNQIKKIKNVPMVFFGIIIIAFMVRTIRRNIDWKNQDNLWLAAAKTSPSSAQNHNNLGDYYARYNQPDRAIEEFRRAIELKPGYADAMHNLANIYLGKKEVNKAIEFYQMAIKFNPRLWQSHQNLSSIFFEQKKYQLAENHLLEAIKIYPENDGLHANLGALYLTQGKKQQSKKEFEAALQLNPENQRVKQFLENAF